MKNTIWVFSADEDGNRNNAMGAARLIGRQLGLPVVNYRSYLPKELRFYDSYVDPEVTDKFLKGNMTENNVPLLIISADQRSTKISDTLARYFNKEKEIEGTNETISRKDITFVHFNIPQLEIANHLDLIVAAGGNQKAPRFISTLGTTDRLTEEVLKHGYDKNQQYFDKDKKYSAVLIGGDSVIDLTNIELGAKDAEDMAHKLIKYSQQSGFHHIIHFSRRTNKEFKETMTNVFKEQNFESFTINDYIHNVDTSKSRPEIPQLFEASLKVAQSVIATDDSVSMQADAAGRGTQLEIYKCSSVTQNSAALRDHLFENGIAREFDGNFSAWKDLGKKYSANDEIAGAVIEAIQNRLRANGKELSLIRNRNTKVTIGKSIEGVKESQLIQVE